MTRWSGVVFAGLSILLAGPIGIGAQELEDLNVATCAPATPGLPLGNDIGGATVYRDAIELLDREEFDAAVPIFADAFHRFSAAGTHSRMVDALGAHPGERDAM